LILDIDGKLALRMLGSIGRICARPLVIASYVVDVPFNVPLTDVSPLPFKFSADVQIARGTRLTW